MWVPLETNVELSTLTHWFDFSAKAKVLNTKLCIQWGIMQYWGYFHILENLGTSLGRVFVAILGELPSWLCHCDESPVGTQWDIE